MDNAVVITKAKKMDYSINAVHLPLNFGSRKYYQRQDVQSIFETVKKNLTHLEKETGFLHQVEGKKVIIKPNLVTVYHRLGYEKESYPETTDPRVIDAVIHYFKTYAKEIVIAESSGIGMPTRLSFKIAGLDRLAKYHKVSLIPLEEQPVHRYYLPKARVMKEILIPRLFTEVVENKAFYLSLPKLKTNLYTKVTLGFKNAMGIIPYNLRLRNHNFLINEKLVDILYLIKPDLVVIDGIIGGEGNTPAPVDPVDSRLIISGTNCVETDKVATQLMGFNPADIKLITHATNLGFGDDSVKIIGKIEPVSFKPADQSLISKEFAKLYPNVQVLFGKIGFSGEELSSKDDIDKQFIVEQASRCEGGCIASIRTALENIRYQGHSTNFQLTIIIGEPITDGKEKYYFDSDTQSYSLKEIKNLPTKTLAIGTCSSELQPIVDTFISGCMPKPMEPILETFKLLKIPNYNFSPIKNKYLFSYLVAKFKQTRKRKKLLRRGYWLDCFPEGLHRSISPPPNLNHEDQGFLAWPLPEMNQKTKKIFLRNEHYLK
jgi:uncharacterized protein (DUF362 family)